MERTRRFGLRWLACGRALWQYLPRSHRLPLRRKPRRLSPTDPCLMVRKRFSGKPHGLAVKQFDPPKLTAAHRTLHFGSNVKVTDVQTGRSVVVQITDRGPYLPGPRDRPVLCRRTSARYRAARRRTVRIELVERDERPAIRRS